MRRVLSILAICLVCLSCHNNKAAKSGPAEDTVAPSVSNNNSNSNTTNAAPATETKEVAVEPTPKSEDVKWMSYEEAVKASKKKPKKIFVDVYTDWCGWCKKMEKTTMKDPKIATYLNSKYYAVKLNAESDKKITYMGKEISEKDLATKVFKITGYPSTVYLNSNEKMIQPIPGFMDVPTLDKILHYVGDDHYKTTTWEKFQLSYKE